jgi:hypothetical protein
MGQLEGSAQPKLVIRAYSRRKKKPWSKRSKILVPSPLDEKLYQDFCKVHDAKSDGRSCTKQV